MGALEAAAGLCWRPGEPRNHCGCTVCVCVHAHVSTCAFMCAHACVRVCVRMAVR